MNQNQVVTFTMKFDPADLAKLSGMIAATLGAKGTVTAAGAPATATGSSNPSFSSILKPLLFLELIEQGIKVIVKNSSVANTYLGVMGKMFGAAVDLLLVPFLPIFNLLLVGMGKLVEWLTRDDVQKVLTKIGNAVLKAVEQFGNDAKSVAEHAKDFADKGKDFFQPAIDAINFFGKVLDKLGIKGTVQSGIGDLAVLNGAALAAKLSPIPGLKQLGGGILRGEGFLASKLFTGAMAGGRGYAAAGIGAISEAVTLPYFAGNSSNFWNDKFGNNESKYNSGPSQGPPYPFKGDWPSVNINVHGVTDPKAVANLVKDAITDLGRGIGLR